MRGAAAVRACLAALLIWVAGTAGAQVIPPLGPNFEVDGITASTGLPATTAINQAGDYVVVFSSRDAGSTAGSHLYGRVVSASGALVGPSRFLISADAPNDTSVSNGAPQVASALDGSFVVVWARRGGPNGTGVSKVFGRRYTTATGVPAPLGPAFPLAPPATIGLWQTGPQVSADLNGNFVAFWSAINTALTSLPGDFCTALTRSACTAYFRGFDRDGVENIAETGIRPPGANFATFASGIARSVTNGRFMLLWDYGLGDQTANDPCILNRPCARLYAADGTPLSERFQPFPDLPGSEIYSDTAVAADFAGSFLFARMVTVGVAPSQSVEVRLRRVDRDGAEVTAERVVDAGPVLGGIRLLALSAANVAGNILLVSQGLTSGLRARWLPENYDDDSVPEVPAFLVGSGLPFTSGGELPAAAMALDGSMLVAFAGTSAVDPNGTRPAARIFTPPVEVRINDVAVSEGNALRATAAFTVQLSRPHPSGVPISVGYETEADGTATAFVDYTPVSGSLSFAPGGAVAQPLTVQVLEDDEIEQDETYSVNLFDVTNAVIVRGRGLGTILNDDTGGVLLVRNVQRVEGDAGTQPLLFEVTLSAPQGIVASADYVTIDESATAGSDYRASFGTISIPPGLTSAFVAVDVFGDTAFETDETLRLALFEPVGATISPAAGSNAGRGTIISDDLCPLAPTITPASANYPVAGGSGSVAVTDTANCGWVVSTVTPWIAVTASPNCPAGSPPTCTHGGTGNGTVQYSVQASVALNQRIGGLTVADLPVTVTQDGIQCNFTLTPPAAVFASSGGTGSVGVNASNALCAWTAVSQAPWLIITESPNCPPGSVANCAHGGTGSGSVAYRVDINEGVDRATSLVAAAAVHAVDQAGFFFDDFDNGVLSPLWTYTGAAQWSEAASRLTGNAPGATPVQAIARPAFAGCIRCTITAKLRFDQFAQGSARLYAWYLQPGTYVDLIVDEFANTWTLRQHVGGTVVAEVAVNVATVANRDYTVQLD
jgi:hypothetical protein